MEVPYLRVTEIANTGELIKFEDSRWIPSLYKDPYDSAGRKRCLAVLCSTPERGRFQLNVTAMELRHKLEQVKQDKAYPQSGYIVTGPSENHPGHEWYDIVDTSPIE
jgi:hypothetical protein